MKKLALLSFLPIFLFGFMLATPRNSLAQDTCDCSAQYHPCWLSCQNCFWYNDECIGECACTPDASNPCSSVCKNCYWYEQTCKGGLEKEVHNPLLSPALSVLSGSDFLQKFLSTGVRLGFFVGPIVFFFLLLMGAIKWITSGGDKARLESAQKQITHALVGLVILLSIFVIIGIIESIFGISITNIILPTL